MRDHHTVGGMIPMSQVSSYKTFGKALRDCVCAFYDEEGYIRDEPLKTYIPIKLTPDRIGALRKLVQLVMLTDYTDRYTKCYLSHPTYTYSRVAKTINLETEETYSDTKVRCKIWYTVQKISQLLGEEAINNIVYYGVEDISNYHEILDKELAVFSTSVLNHFVIPLRCEKITKELDKDSFEELLNIIRPYSKTYVGLIQRSIEGEMLQYFNYLISQRYVLSGIDEERYNQIVDML